VYCSTSGRTVGSLLSSLSRLNFSFALEDNYEYVPSARYQSIECRVVYVVRNDRYRSSALTPCPSVVRACFSDCIGVCLSGQSRSRLLLSRIVSPALVWNPAPRYLLHWNFPWVYLLCYYLYCSGCLHREYSKTRSPLVPYRRLLFLSGVCRYTGHIQCFLYSFRHL
jgi:hypothetical protein